MKWVDISNTPTENIDIDSYKRDWSFIVFEFMQSAGCNGCEPSDIIEWIKSKSLLSASLLHMSDSVSPVETAQTNDNRLVFCFKNPSEAIGFALHVLPLNHPIKMAIGCGEGYLLDTFQSVHLLDTYSIVSECSFNEIVCTNELINKITLPDGIGSFAASNSQRNRIGKDFYIIRDYRCS